MLQRYILIVFISFFFFGCDHNDAFGQCTHWRIHNPKYTEIKTEDFYGFEFEACERMKPVSYRQSYGKDGVSLHKNEDKIAISRTGRLTALSIAGRLNNEILIYDRDTKKITQVVADKGYVRLRYPSFSKDEQKMAVVVTPYPYTGVAQIFILDLTSGEVMKKISRTDGGYGLYSHPIFGCDDKCLFYAKHLASPPVKQKSTPHFGTWLYQMGFFHYDLKTDVERQIENTVFQKVDSLFVDDEDQLYVFARELLVDNTKQAGYINYVSRRMYQFGNKDLPVDDEELSRFGVPYPDEVLIKTVGEGENQHFVPVISDPDMDGIRKRIGGKIHNFEYFSFPGLSKTGGVYVGGGYNGNDRGPYKQIGVYHISNNAIRNIYIYPVEPQRYPGSDLGQVVPVDETKVINLLGEPFGKSNYRSDYLIRPWLDLTFLKKGDIVEAVHFSEEFIDENIQRKIIVETGQ